MKSKQLLFSISMEDLTVQTFCSGGKGGQNQNKRESGVRLIHEPSGAVGESREHREQMQNKKAAFKRLANSEKLQKWIRLEAARRTGLLNQLDQKVEEELREKNLKVEVKDEEGLWRIWNEKDV